MNPLRKLFSPSAEKVAVIFERNCFVGSIQHLEDSEASFDARTAAELVASGAARNPESEKAAAEKKQSLEQQLPPPVEPAPVPEAWANLPACFPTWWKLNEARAALVARLDAMERIIADWDAARTPNFKGINHLPSEDSARLFSTFKFNTAADFASDVEKLKYLKNAIPRAEKAIEDWKTANLPSLVKAQLECSTHTQLVHGALCKGIRELHSKGLELFALRIEPLGLSAHKVSELFKGSADCEKFARIQAPTLQDLKLAWHEEGQSPVHYINLTPKILASMLAGYAQTAAQVSTLTKQADKELVAAQQVNKAAA